MKPTRGNSSPTWCSTFATTRRGVVQLSAWHWKLLYRMSGVRLGRPGARNRRPSIASSKFLFAGIRIAYWTPRASRALLHEDSAVGRFGPHFS